MNQESGTEGAHEVLDPAWGPPDRRRVLQLALATIWLIDGVLQLQPVMFSRSFALTMLAPTAQGNPAALGRPITDVAGVIGRHPVSTDAVFAVVQLLIALAIANRRTVRLGLAGSVVWSLLVWWFGEGLGQVFTGQASPLNGAPGAVLLYAFLAVLLWPGDRPAGSVAGRAVGQGGARAMWVVVWGALGIVALAESATRRPGQLLSSLEAGEPGWLVALDHRLVGVSAHHGPAVAAVVGAVLLALAVSGALRSPPKGAVVVAVAVGLVVWVFGENFGLLFTGTATDPNSGPLLVLFALVYWPLRPQAMVRPEAAPELMGAART